MNRMCRGGASAALAFAVLTAAPALAQGLVVSAPEGFRASGAAINGWTWIRSEGNFAQWYWGPDAAALAREACVNFSLLATNGPSGGSGHDAEISTQILGNDGTSVSARLALKNPFRPVVSSDTRGVGYQAYGALCSTALARLLTRGFRVRLQWTGTMLGDVGVRAEGVVLAYVSSRSGPHGQPPPR